MTLRRILTLIAVCALLGVVSGDAWAGELTTRKIDFRLVSIDTANHVSLDVANKVNDSILFISKSWGVSHEFSQITARLVPVTKDTVLDNTAGDTVIFDLQTKFDTPLDTVWWRVGGSTKVAENAMGTSPGNCTVKIPVDSIPSMGDIMRMRFWLVLPVDSIRAHDVAGIVPFAGEYQLYLTMRLR